MLTSLSQRLTGTPAERFKNEILGWGAPSAGNTLPTSVATRSSAPLGRSLSATNLGSEASSRHYLPAPVIHAQNNFGLPNPKKP